MYEISVEGFFSAAHRLREYQGKCENLHGHNWKVRVVVSAKELDRVGMVMDFKVLKILLEQVLSDLDHRNLCDLPEFKQDNPTAENIAHYVFQHLAEKIKDPRIKLLKVDVWETPGQCASYFYDSQ